MSVPLKVLIIEDSVDDTEFLLRELRHGEFDPSYVRVDSPRALRDALKEDQWDIILSDYYMPGFSALTALQIVHDLDVNIPFVVITGATGEDIAVEAMRAGARDYLLKHNLRRLVSVVQRELRVSSSNITRNNQHDEIEKDRNVCHEIINTISVPIVVLDYKDNVLMINKYTETLLGYAADEVTGKQRWQNICDEHDINRLIKNNSAESETVFTQTCKTKDGDKKQLVWSYKPVNGTQAGKHYFVATEISNNCTK